MSEAIIAALCIVAFAIAIAIWRISVAIDDFAETYERVNKDD